MGRRSKHNDHRPIFYSLKEGIRTKELLVEMMSKNTGQKPAKVRDDMERDYWMNAKEAVEYGIVDGVIEKA